MIKGRLQATVNAAAAYLAARPLAVLKRHFISTS
jgi:hypothetical protein